MGVDKALLPLGNENLLQRALRTASGVCANPVIVGDRDRYSSCGEVIEDRMPGCGPLGGIHAALCVTKSDRNLILSVDMPLMTPEFLIWLVSQSGVSDELAIVPQPGDKGGDLPMAVRDRGDQARPALLTTAPSSHVGGGPGLVDEDEPGRIKPALALAPPLARGVHVRAHLFGGVGVFLN